MANSADKNQLKLIFFLFDQENSRYFTQIKDHLHAMSNPDSWGKNISECFLLKVLPRVLMFKQAVTLIIAGCIFKRTANKNIRTKSIYLPATFSRISINVALGYKEHMKERKLESLHIIECKCRAAPSHPALV